MSQRVDYLERTKINHRRSRQDSPIEDASTITSAAQLWDKERKTYDKKLYGLQKQNQALFDRVRFLENLAPDHNINSEPNVSGAKTKAKTPALPGADPAAEADSDTDSDASIDSEASADAEVTASVDTVTVETQTSYNFDGYIQSLEKKLEETRVTMRKKDMDLMKVKELQEDLEKSDRAGEESKILIDQLTQQLASVRDELAAEEDDAKEKQMTLHVRIDKLVKELEEKKKETQAFVNQEAHQTQVMQVLKTKHGRELAELRKDYDNRIATLSAKVEEKVVERKALVAQHDVNRAQTEAEVNLRIEKIEEEMNERMSDKEKELMAAHQKELKTAKRKHSKEMRELNKKADQRIAELSTQMTERELELERFTDQGIQHTETVKALRKELAGKMNDLRKDYNQVTQDHNQLQEENDALLRELECSQTSLKQHIEETVLLQAELKKREDRRTKEGNLLAELESKMQSRVKSIAKLRERLSARDMSIIEFEEKIAELECALEETVKKAMDDREQIGLILKREEHIHRHRLDQLQRKYQRKLKERELIHREQLDDLRGELQNARHTISELTKKYDDDLLDLRCILLDFKDVKQNDKERSSASGGTDGITSDEHVTGSNSAASSANHANRNNDVNAIHEGGNDLSPHLSLSSLTLHSTGQPSASRSNPPPVSSLSTTTSNEACAPTTPPAPPRLSSLSASELTIAIPSVSASDIEPEVASDVASEAESCDADLDVSVVHFHQQLNEDDDDSSGDDIFHNSDGTDEKRIDNHADEGWRKYLPYADSDSSSSG